MAAGRDAKMIRLKSVMQVIGDQCMYGLITTARVLGGAASAKKPTMFVTNLRQIAAELSMRCDGKHQHQSLVGIRARKATEYPEGLCRDICRGAD